MQGLFYLGGEDVLAAIVVVTIGVMAVIDAYFEGDKLLWKRNDSFVLYENSRGNCQL